MHAILSPERFVGKYIHVIKNSLMTVGFVLFILLSVLTFLVAGTSRAARERHDPQPELQAVSRMLR